MADTGPVAADLVLTGGAVVTMDDERRVLDPGAVAVAGDRIIGVFDGPPPPSLRAGRTVDCTGTAVVPGFADCHTHLFQTLARGLGEGLGGWRWLAEFMWPYAGAERRRMDLVLHVASTSGPGIEPKSTDASDPFVQFSDTPNFTVAGITDRSNMGLHGSDANVRTSDALAKETVSLKSQSAEKSPTFGIGDTHRLAGDAKEKNGDPVGAVKEYQAAVKADPSEQNYFAWGAELLLHHAGQPAVQVFSAGAKAHPNSARMLAGLGAAYYSNGQYNEAASESCRASELNPADPSPYLFLGKMEQAAADPLPCSETALSRFATNQPANPLANFFYGLVLWKKARKTQDAANLTRAEQLFQRALVGNPQFAEVYLQLGMLYNARGEKDSALAEFQKAVSADPKSSGAHYQLSLAYRRAGDARRADQELKTYDELRRLEDAALEKERRELRQFVTILKKEDSSSTRE